MVFFFKQKTAYEMRISDWSSDVCSSDLVDVDHARAKGIRVTNTPDVLTDDVADLAVGLLYATVRNIAANDRMVRAGDWARGVKPALSGRVTGRRIGILGLGRIGRAIARRLEPVAGELF